MHAFLVTGSTPDHRSRRIALILSHVGVGESVHCRYLLSTSEDHPESLTIDEVRQLQHWLAQVSRQPRAAIIAEAQRLTVPAQHSLLKSIEDPGENTYFVLTASSELALLPTIRSRCKIYRLSTPEQSDIDEALARFMSKIPTQTPARRIGALYETLSAFVQKPVSVNRGAIIRTDGLRFLEALIGYCHTRIYEQSASPDALRLSHCLTLAAQAHQRLRQNLNPALVLQQFMLDL